MRKRMLWHRDFRTMFAGVTMTLCVKAFGRPRALMIGKRLCRIASTARRPPKSVTRPIFRWPDRPRALTAIANALLQIDRAKGWEAAAEAVKAANGAEGFTGEDGVFRISLITKSGSSVRSTSSGEFNVAGVFSELAKDDYNKSVEVIRGFE